MLIEIAAAAHIKVFTALLVYLFSGHIEIEKKPFPTLEACMEYAQPRANKLAEDPRFGGGLFAACVEEEGQKS